MLFRLTSEEKICRQTKARERAATLVNPQESETKEELTNIDWEILIPQLPIIVNCKKKGLKANQLKSEGTTHRENEETIVIPEYMIKVEILELA